ncbi:MAG TPA: inositol monophosphatase family protein [Lacisediminihabitans sp.]|uniref:inositol monophosphatase family protein n=1 Tax=Lacisediminihabitans sp. TaxID=2787631 RepID=UPI002ED80E44
MDGTTELLGLAREIALTAGELVARRRAEGVEVAASKSSTEDIVTFADRESEALIRSLLAEARPDDGFLGEESGADAGSSGLTWVVDPIDGTVNFLYGIPHYAVSIAVVEGEPEPTTWSALAGVVVNPASGELFTATAGGGAFLGDRRIRVAPPVELSQALVGTGFGYLAEVRTEQAAVVAGLIHRVRDIRRMGTASLDLCAVACGRLNAYYERGLRPWDHAAGALIAAESGASVGGLRGAPASQAFTLAAEPTVAARLEEVLLDLVG